MFILRAKNLDNPQTTQNYHASLIRNKYYLNNIYRDFYNQFKLSISHISTKKKLFVELGSGGGFIKEIIPETTTSDIMKLKNIDMQFSALKMPFAKNSVDAFFMIDVFHHISDSKRFLNEAQKCLKKKGKIVMIEPANTLFGGIIYKHFHHETFNPQGEWYFKSQGPLSSSNLALPWIVFFRDKQKFKKLFPNLIITKIEIHTPFRYLLSGGLSFPQFVPFWTYGFIVFFEKLLKKLHPYIGMFYTIELTKK